MTSSNEARRIALFMLALGTLGTAVAYFWQGRETAVGFGAGAALSGLNFRWLHRMVDSIGQPGTSSRPVSASAVLLSLRYLLFAGAGYAIFKYSEVSLMAALAGCFVFVAAVFLEAIYELIYA